ncbi:uncharacterized protein K02A2.6-like [Strongylocentrotus purpuratus]|uniref:RNA-directed DNA polymerase n=1 Tax=Strongylocentrotus purpuratus TaxID=7668 RepID=A0A7M7HLL2_STRPU|nr:uncharacterized protein K02A2.6-like [Strongylocentrotus purpuratus]
MPTTGEHETAAQQQPDGNVEQNGTADQSPTQLATGRTQQRVSAPPPVSGIRPPPQLTINRGVIEGWKTWRQMWTNYSVVAHLDRQASVYQTALFLHTIGPLGLEIYNSFVFANANGETSNLDEIIEAFERYAVGEKNETYEYERYLFNKRQQEPGESFESFLANLRSLAKSCNFCKCMTDSLLRDKIVLGTNDAQTRKQLLQERKLTLGGCIDICKSAETAESHLKAFSEAGSSRSAAHIHKIRPSFKKGKQSGGPKRDNSKRSTGKAAKSQCKYCGREHPRDKNKCPAYGQTCKACGKQNHFANVCMLSKRMHQVNDPADSDSSTEYIDNVTITINTVKPRDEVYARMMINEKAVDFQVDSGASANILPLRHLEGADYVLKPSKKKLMMWNEITMAIEGVSRVKMLNPKTKQKYSVEFIVVDKDFTPLLGSTVSQHLKLITVNNENFIRVHAASSQKDKACKPEERYAEVFDGELGEMPGEVNLQVDKEVQPTILPPRRLPHAIKQKVKAELDRMVDREVIAKVTKPTSWVSQLVVAEKKNGDLRICIDPRPLNKALKREHYPLPIVEDILPDLNQAKIFSKLDMSSAFWQVKLDEPSSHLTTFNTPFGRYRWRRLPFGTSASSEIFQQRLHQALEGLPGVICVADDILVYGKGTTMEEAIIDHDSKLEQLFQRCVEQHIKLNKEKSVFRATEIPFLGHVVTSAGLQPDPKKVADVLKMPNPSDVQGVQRLVGFVNYLSRFLPSLSDTLEPIRQLTRPDIAWEWSTEQANAMSNIKRMVSEAPLLAYYNPKEELTIQCDASNKGLGAALLQNGRPIAYASRSLTDTESRYASIEKEMLAVVFSMERFHQYTFGRFTSVVSDHKPLEMIIKKPLVKAPKRLQGMLLRLQKYHFDISYQQGKLMYLADTLSRAVGGDPSEVNFFEEVNMVAHLPIRDERLQQIREQTAADQVLQKLKSVIVSGWPNDRHTLPEELTPYFGYRDELAVHDGLIFKGERVIIPISLRKEMKEKIHSSHLGMEGCLRRARESIFWPGMASEIKQFIATCDVCRSYEVKQQKEPLMAHDLPQRPWEKIGTDLFSLKGKDYMVTVDYYSNFFEVDRLDNTSSQLVIRKLKAHFARYGSPTQVVSDNGPQYTSAVFRQFASEWDFEHLCSSPGNSRANGKAESAVKTAKRIIMKSDKSRSDTYLALLDHRNTPSQGLDTSPAQRLMNRRTRTLLPTSASLLEPRVIREREKMQLRIAKQAYNYNKSAKDLTPLQEGDTVRMQPLVQGQKNWERAIVKRRLDERSYVVETPSGIYRRNRVHLRQTPENPPDETTTSSNETAEIQHANDHNATPDETEARPAPQASQSNDIELAPKTRSGRTVKRPNYLKDYVTR